MYDLFARAVNFLIRSLLAAILLGAVLAVLAVAFLLLHFAAHLF